MLSNEYGPQLPGADDSRHEAIALRNEAVHFEGGGYTSLAALSSDWYWEQDSSYRFTKLVRSPFAAPFPGLSKNVLIGRRRWEGTGARSLSETWDQHRDRLEARQPFRDFQYSVFVGPHGVLSLSASGEPVFDARGRFAGYRGTSRDIATDWGFERQLLDARAPLPLSVTAEPVGAWSVDLQSSEFYWSNEARAILDIPVGSLSSREYSTHSCPLDYRRELRSAIAACVAASPSHSSRGSSRPGSVGYGTSL